ncbi:phosphomannomutase [Lasius niger]|uniref:Phosphomannomutase n=1 Tax=Lasius niger TaxID=67767 RepID=A0A0J7K2U2_LASNI|nr:phosphomannomutase [Lasius niger]
MLPVVDKPLIQYAIDEAREAGIEEFCLITARGKDNLIDYFDVAYELESMLKKRNKKAALQVLEESSVSAGSLVAVRQQNPLGLGHAIWCARSFIGSDPFAVLLPDDIVLGLNKGYAMSSNAPFSHKFNQNILRAYDIRGVVGTALHPADAYAIGCTFAEKVRLAGGKKIVVGYDGRLSSEELEKNLVSGILDAGLDVLRIGLGPTPMVYFAAVESDVDASVMITGSHNPGNYNGFKFTLKGKPFYGDAIQGLAKLAEEGLDLSGRNAGQVENKSVKENYVKRIAKDYQGKRPLKVVWDSGNSAAGPVLEALTAILPGEHEILFAEVDGNFPNHHPDPTVEKNLVFLKEAVVKSKADIGVAFDGDADRVGVIDNLGNVMWGDQILAFLAADILKDAPGATIIGEVKCSQNTYDAIKAAGGTPLMWKCGHSFIKAKMAERCSYH